MPHYLVLDPEMLKRAIIAEGDTSDERAMLESIPSGTSLPKVVVVVDREQVAGLQRFLVDDDTDAVLSEQVVAIKRVQQPLEVVVHGRTKS